MDIDKELEDLFDDPLLDISEKRSRCSIYLKICRRHRLGVLSLTTMRSVRCVRILPPFNLVS